VVGVAIGWPAAFAGWTLVKGAAGAPMTAVHAAIPNPSLLLKTLGVAALIATGATILGWPAAWAGRSVPARISALLTLPLLLPSYLISSGWGLLRAPGTVLGNWIMAPGREQYVIPLGYGLALVGLMLWASPIAAMLASAHLRRTDPEAFEALRMVAGSRGRYWTAVAGMARGGILAGFAAVFLVMLGSAVPLHVAQLDTYAIELWRTLDETPAAEHWRIWVAGWPLVTVAIATAWFIARRLTAESAEGARIGHSPTASVRVSPSLVLAALVWALAVVAPVALYLMNLRGVSTLETFWRVTWKPIVSSAEAAGWCALGSLMISAATWMALAGGLWARRVAWASLVTFLAAGLSPGVLIGSSTAHAWNSADWMAPIADSVAVIVLAHLARFGFLGALAGWWLARTEPQELRDLRRLDAGESIRGWIRAAMPPQAGLLVAAALATGLLSFHEIESAVMLQPPSNAGGGLAWVMLQQLHFARTQELAAGMLYLIGGGVTFALVVVWLLGKRGVRRTNGPTRA
jgi:ABC-type Fe3+ transport system permease subunit